MGVGVPDPSKEPLSPKAMRKLSHNAVEVRKASHSAIGVRTRGVTTAWCLSQSCSHGAHLLPLAKRCGCRCAGAPAPSYLDAA